MQSLGKKYKRITGVDALVGNKCLGSHGGWAMLTSWKVGLKKGCSNDIFLGGKKVVFLPTTLSKLNPLSAFPEFDVLTRVVAAELNNRCLLYFQFLSG